MVPQKIRGAAMYYAAFDDVNSDFTTTRFFCGERPCFSIASGVLPRFFLSIGDDKFSMSARMEWIRDPVPGQAVRQVTDQSGRTVATVTYLGGNLNLLRYNGGEYRIMRLGSGWAGFSGNGTMIFCLKQLSRAGDFPDYAHRHIFCMEGYAYEMMVDDDLPKPLQMLLAASPQLAFRSPK